jgi:16S rRNA processing protein RimM
MEQYLKIGIITSTHALKGEVKVFPTTDDKKRFSLLKNMEVFLDRDGQKRPIKVADARYFKEMVILKFEGIDRIEEAAVLVRSEIYVDRKDGVPLGEDEYYIADLIGLEVYSEENEYYGTISDVMQTGANDVYCVKSKKYGEILIPAIKQCIMNVDLQGGRLIVDLLPGLLPETNK